jgi:hypothetical protein
MAQEGKLMVMGALASRSSVIFDLDDDGDLDLVTNEFNAEPQVLVSNLTQKKEIHFIKVQLTGTKSNRNGLGATVTVVAKDKRFLQVHDSNSGYLSHSILPLYFGLGDSQTIDRIEVRWPSGKEQTMQKPTALNTVIQILEES